MNKDSDIGRVYRSGELTGNLKIHTMEMCVSPYALYEKIAITAPDDAKAWADIREAFLEQTKILYAKNHTERIYYHGEINIDQTITEILAAKITGHLRDILIKEQSES